MPPITWVTLNVALTKFCSKSAVTRALGSESLSVLMTNDKDWDEGQWNVISASCNDRIIVEAGPGTGKTAVACRRLAYLIEEENLASTNTWMISFTRVAVKEILSRLHSYVGDESYGIRVATIDSHAWAIHSGHDARATLTGTYEQNIERVIELLETNEDVAEELKQVEHVVIDEAQDIVGVRAEFIETLVNRLSPSCGVTLFVDEAQAIYNFSDESIFKHKKSTTKPLHERIKALRERDFNTAKLTTIHRTSIKDLQSIFSDVREEIVDPKNHHPGIHENTAQRIMDLATENVEDEIDIKIDEFSPNTLLLYRTRAEVLQASQFSKRPHKVRMSEYGPTLPAWLAQCFWDYTDKFLSKDSFFELWMERLSEKVRTVSDAERRWGKLIRVAGRRDGVVNMEWLTKRLSQKRPPVELAVAEYGLKGPIAGTVHASKGRESENAVVLLPKGSSFKDIDEEVEETRVLFVGATRAKSCLVVRNAGNTLWAKTLDSGRMFRATKNRSFQVEIGRDGDILPKGLVGRRALSRENANIAQNYLSKRASRVSSFNLEADPSLDWNYRIKTEKMGLCLGVMSPEIRYDAWEILKINKQSDVRFPPKTVKRVKCLGSRTIVLSENDSELEELHKPWSESGFLLAPRLVSFAPFYYGWRRNL